MSSSSMRRSTGSNKLMPLTNLPIAASSTVTSANPVANSGRISPNPSSQHPSPRQVLPPMTSNSASSSKSENIQVCVRIRPGAHADDMSMYGWELSDNDTKLIDSSGSIGGNGFYFDRVYRPQTPTQTMYQQSIKHVITSFCSGMNATIFAYGQTGQQKTRTRERERERQAGRQTKKDLNSTMCVCVCCTCDMMLIVLLLSNCVRQARVKLIQ